MNEYVQLVLVSFHNGGNFFYEVKSDKPITMERVVAYFEETEGWSEDRDSIEFFEGPNQIVL